MKTQYYTATSLDGFIATVDHSLEWLFQLGDVNDTSYPQFIAEVGVLAMGASTYEWVLRHVIKQGSDEPAHGLHRCFRDATSGQSCIHGGAERLVKTKL